MKRRIFAVAVVGTAALVLSGCDEPGEACTNEGHTKHYSTGKVITCENGKWVMKNGVGFTR